MIVTNPLLTLLPTLRPTAPTLAEPDAAKRDHDALASLVAHVAAVLALGEWHEIAVSATPTAFPHKLGRKPSGRYIVWQDGPRVLVDDRGLWTNTTVTFHASAGTMNVGLVLV